MTEWQEYAIYPGYNNAALLIPIETMQDASGVFFKPVVGHPALIDGLGRIGGDGIEYLDGYPSTRWSSVMYWTGYLYLYTTVLAGAYSGPVTMRTRVRSSTYANYNAVLKIPMPGNLVNVRKGRAYRDFVWTFTRMEAV